MCAGGEAKVRESEHDYGIICSLFQPRASVQCTVSRARMLLISCCYSDLLPMEKRFVLSTEVEKGFCVQDGGGNGHEC